MPEVRILTSINPYQCAILHGVLHAVLQVFYREAGKNGKHCWASSCDNVGLVSYMSVQVYEHVHHAQFRAVLRRMAPFQTYTFVHVSADEFLCLLPGNHRLSPDGRSLGLDEHTIPFFEQFERPDVVQKTSEAVKLLKKARRNRRKKLQRDGILSGSESED